jgi:Ni/Fe-hydrogenase subunit HybB-like protein
MFLFTILGVVLSFMHQSSLGATMILAPTKIDPLWWTPILPLLFLLSAITVGYPMVIVESMIASRSFGKRPEIELLSSLARFIVFTLGIYISAKIFDWVVRDQVGRLFSGNTVSILCLIEFLFGAVVPFFMLLSSNIRRNPRLLFLSALLIVLGVVFNRINVYLTAYTPPFAQTVYFPSFSEISLTVGMIAGLMLMYRVIVMIFPVIPQGESAHAN